MQSLPNTSNGDRLSPFATAPARLTFSVIVPTYRRIADLWRCLDALQRQECVPDEVVVICRDTDVETVEALRSYPSSVPLSVLHVTEPGQVAALNLGLSYVTSDIVAITDDDAAPRPEWLRCAREHYEADSTLGGVGGRDYIEGYREGPESLTVGRVQWIGRTVGNHHLGVGGPRQVDFLKGANMTFRRKALGSDRFDKRLRGSGAQVHNDMALCLAVRKRGWKLVYDPAVAVDHYPGVRFGEDVRHGRSIVAVADSAFNETLAIVEYLPRFRRVPYLFWAILVGTRDAPGLAQSVRFGCLKVRTWQAFIAVAKSRIAALAEAGS